MIKLKNLIILSVLLLAGCSQTPAAETVAEDSNETTTAVSVSETVSSETNVAQAETTAAETEAPFMLTDNHYIIFWKENGVEQQEVLSGIPVPDIIITNVLDKYFKSENNSMIYAADWVTDAYYETIENEDGPVRTAHTIASLDLSEGYSVYVGEEMLNDVTESIAWSLIENFDLSEITISEMRETILQITND